jgi:DNA-binding HxlR family transcriptional regulator
VGSSDITEYCSFTKAIEHLGDRWSLLIVRELAIFGAQGFNALASGLPGRVSRAILTERLRRLEELGLVARKADRYAPYRLTDAGAALVPTILSLRTWADAWIPDDPAMVRRDPTIILAWLRERLDPAALPEQQSVLDVTMRGEPEYRGWLVIQRELEPYGCAEDPMLDESRYVFVDSGAAVMMGLARGHRAWSDALRDGSLNAYGNPDLAAELPRWFRPALARPPLDPIAGLPPRAAVGGVEAGNEV